MKLLRKRAILCAMGGWLACGGVVCAEDQASPSAVAEGSIAAQRTSQDAPTAAAPSAPASHTPEVVVEYQVLPSETEAMQTCQQFIQKVMAGSYDDAFKFIRPYFPISERRFTKLAEETKKQHGLAQLQFGKPLGAVFVSAQSIKDSVIKFRFLEKFEWDVMYWEFMFYKPQNGWLLNGLGFDDDVQGLFK